VFSTELCNFKELRSKKTGKCKPCPIGSYSVEGPFSTECISKEKTSSKVKGEKLKTIV